MWGDRVHMMSHKFEFTGKAHSMVETTGVSGYVCLFKSRSFQQSS